MKKMKKSLLSLVTAFIMSASMLPSMMTASAEYVTKSTVLTENFESTVASMPNGTTIATDSQTGNKYLNISTSWREGWYAFDTVDSGLVKVTFDYMTTATGSSFHFDMADRSKGFSDKEFLTLIRRTGGTNMEGAAGNYKKTYESGVWYNVENIIDMDTKAYTVTVSKKATGEVVYTTTTTLSPSTAGYVGWPNTATKFDTFAMSSGAAGCDNIDNIVIEQIEEKPVEKVLYSNDLESGITLDKTTTVADPTDATNNVAKYNAGWAQPNIKLSEPVSSGIVEVKFDYMANASNSSFHVDLAADRNTKNFLTFFRRTGTLIEGPGSGNYGNVELGKWYTIDSVVNLDTKHYMSVVKDKATGKVLESVDTTLTSSSREFKDWPETVNEFTDFFFQGGSAEDYLDNILVKTLLEEPEMPKVSERVLYSNDLESGKTLDKTTTVADPKDSSNNVAKYNAGWAQPNVKLSEKVSSGIIEVKFDYMANGTNSSFHVDLAADRNTKNFLTFFRRTGTLIEGPGEGNYGNVETGKWYTIDSVVNFDTKHYMSVVKDKATGKVLKSVDVTLAPSSREFKDWPETVNEFTDFFFQGGSAEDYLDNILVKTLMEEPEMEQEEEEVEKELYSNDVESGRLHNGGTTQVADPTNSENKVAKYNGGWYGAGLDLSEKVSSGIVEVKFDYMANATGSSFYFTLAGSERSGKNLLTFVRRSGDKLEGAAGVYAALETGKWYTIDTVVNFDNMHYMSVIKDKATGKVLKSVDTILSPTTAEYSGWPAEINEFTMLFFSGGSTEDYLDNVLVKTLLEEPEMEQEEVDPRLLYSNDFQIGSAPTNGTINSDNTNKYLTLNGGWKNIQYKFNKVTTDKIKVTFDFMNTASNSSFYAALLDSSVSNSDGVEFLNLLRDEKKMECYSSTQNRNILGDHVDNEWLTYEAVIDMNTRKCISTVYNKATGEAIATVEVTLEPSSNNLADWPKTATAFDTFMIVSGRANGTHIDNLLIEKVVDAPVISADKVTIKDAAGEVQTIWTKVSPSTKVFEIAFGTSLDEATVTKDSIYVTKKGSTTPLAGSVVYKDGKAVLTLTDELEINTVYVLNITDEVANILGETLADSVSYEFKTDSGKVSAVMNTPEVDGNAVTSFAALKAGDVIKVPVTYLNTTGEAKDLYFVVAYYKSGFKALADVEFIKTPFAGTIRSGEYEFEHTFKKVDGADSMRFMMWDGFDTLVPLSASVSIK